MLSQDADCAVGQHCNDEYMWAYSYFAYEACCFGWRGFDCVACFFLMHYEGETSKIMGSLCFHDFGSNWLDEVNSASDENRLHNQSPANQSSVYFICEITVPHK